MIEKGKIGLHQFTILTFLFTVGSSILILPSGIAFEAKQDAWIASSVGVVAGLLMVLFFNGISIRFPNKNLVQIAQDTLGKWLGGAVTFLYFCYFFILASLVLRNIGDFMTTQVLPNTPIQFIHILFLVVIIMGIRSGLETFTRTAEIFFPWVVLFFFTMFTLLTPQFDFRHLLPVSGYGIKPILRAAIPVAGTPFTELVIFLMLFPAVNNQQKARKAFLVGVSLGGVVLIIISLISVLVLGADLTARLVYPSYSLAKKISIGSFLERLEVIMAGIWFITIYFKLAVCFYASTITFAELFKLKDARQLYWPFGVVMIVLSIVAYPDFTYFMNFANKIYFPYSITFAIIFPLLILLVSMIRQKSQKT